MNHAQVNKTELLKQMSPGYYVVKSIADYCGLTWFDGNQFEVMQEKGDLHIGNVLPIETILMSFKFGEIAC